MDISQLVRESDCGSEGYGFKSHYSPIQKFKRLVGGSGRRDRLKIYSPFGDAGSIPALSIILLYL